MLSLIFWAALAGAVAYVVIHGVTAFDSATGTVYARALTATKATFSWAFAGLLMLVQGTLDLANNLAVMADLPSVQENINKLSPRWILIIGGGVLAVRVMAAVAGVVRPLIARLMGKTAEPAT